MEPCEYLASTAATAAIGMLVLLAAPHAAGQALAPAAKTAKTAKKAWTPPHTPDGQPDLQGVWTNNTVTPLERPKDLAGKEFYTEAELTEAVMKEGA